MNNQGSKYDPGQKFYAEIEKWDTEQEKLPAGHDRLKKDLYSGRMQVRCAVRQNLHVGSGRLVPPELVKLASPHSLVKEFFRAGRALRIPATSLKGAVRAIVEMLTHSCAPATRGADACRFRDEHSLLCPACNIFGALGFQGRLSFNDGVFLKGTQHAVFEIPPQYGPRPHTGLRRYYPYRLKDERPATWPLEVILPGSSFQFEAVFENLSPAELGVVLLALGQGNPPICLRLGAGKSSGLGGVQVEQLVLQAIDPRQSWTAFEVVSRPLEAAVCLKAADELVVDEALAQLQKDLGCDRLP